MENGSERDREREKVGGKERIGRHMGAVSGIQGDAPYNLLWPFKARSGEKVSLKGAILLDRPQVL